MCVSKNYYYNENTTIIIVRVLKYIHGFNI